ncbi:MAG: class I SAM-dependent methyltransferase [Oligoflexia bacterium]|nr:class I SAM-dependent methyltransferase [Oligoflexia bacterium]
MISEKKETLNFWEDKAKNVEDIRVVTHADTIQRQLEIDTLIKYLRQDDVVADLGCGNGYATAVLADHCKQIFGYDFSPSMIDRAKKENFRDGKIHYDVLDIRKAKPCNQFSKAISIRCLINILDWEDQKMAIKNITDSLVSGGTYLMMEGLADGRCELNRLREKIGLALMPKVDHNLDFEINRTNQYLENFFHIDELKTFGSYEFITRLIYPLYIDKLTPEYGSRFHEIAFKICSELPDLNSSVSKFALWVLKKK